MKLSEMMRILGDGETFTSAELKEWQAGLSLLHAWTGEVDMAMLEGLVSHKMRTMQRIITVCKEKHRESRRGDESASSAGIASSAGSTLSGRGAKGQPLAFARGRGSTHVETRRVGAPFSSSSPSPGNALDLAPLVHLSSAHPAATLDPHDDVCFALTGVRGCMDLLQRYRWLACAALLNPLFSVFLVNTFSGCETPTQGDDDYDCLIPLWKEAYYGASGIVGVCAELVIFGSLQSTIAYRAFFQAETAYVGVLAILVFWFGVLARTEQEPHRRAQFYVPHSIYLTIGMFIIMLSDGMPGKMRRLTLRYVAPFTLLLIMYYSYAYRKDGVEYEAGNFTYYTLGAETLTCYDLMAKGYAAIFPLICRGFVNYLRDPGKLSYTRGKLRVKELRGRVHMTSNELTGEISHAAFIPSGKQGREQRPGQGRRPGTLQRSSSMIAPISMAHRVTINAGELGGINAERLGRGLRTLATRGLHLGSNGGGGSPGRGGGSTGRGGLAGGGRMGSAPIRIVAVAPHPPAS